MVVNSKDADNHAEVNPQEANDANRLSNSLANEHTGPQNPLQLISNLLKLNQFAQLLAASTGCSGGLWAQSVASPCR